MFRIRFFLCVLVAVWAQSQPTTGLQQSITFLGVVSDTTDLSVFGSEGYWMPGWNCVEYSFEQPTNYSEANALPVWAGPLKHIIRSALTEHVNRSFSMDGPCSVIRGDDMYNLIVLPGGGSSVGGSGRSGIIVDPAADENRFCLLFVTLTLTTTLTLITNSIRFTCWLNLISVHI
jgi:hypothetical protein